jgi:formylglycine-generating enzyme
MSSCVSTPLAVPSIVEGVLMDDSEETPRRPPAGAPAFLPRIKDYPLAPGPAETQSSAPPPPPPTFPSKAKEKKGKPEGKSEAKSKDDNVKGKHSRDKGEKGSSKEKKGVLVERTPDLDTYDARRKMRLMLGSAASGLLILVLFVTWRALSGSSPEPEPDSSAETGTTEKSSPKAAHDEAEARVLFGDAHGFAKKGDTKNATRILTRIVEVFPRTAAANDAQQALDRPNKNLPLFVDVPTVSAQPADPPPPPEEVKPPEVVAVPATSPNPPGTAVVSLTPPPTPPEPFRATGLPRDSAKVSAKSLPAGFRIREEAGVHESGWPWEITCDKDGAAMVLIPGGEFTQGRDDGSGNERPAHRVSMPPYYIDQHETTIGQYLIYLKDTGKKAASAINASAAKSDFPVTNASAREARDYLRWAGKELPSEAQWEMASRTIDGRRYPWGNADNQEKARKLTQVEPVMAFSTDLSPYGVFDLAGNAWEFTNDIFDPKYYQQFKNTVPHNPSGPAASHAKLPSVVIKGGSKDWSVSWRDGISVDGRKSVVGFRGVLSLEKPAPVPTSAPGPSSGKRPQGGTSVPF